MRQAKTRLVLVACSVVLGLGVFLPGCALVQFDRYDSFDGWFSATRDPFDPESLGVDGLKKNGTPDYVLNDLIIRSPIFLVRDLARIPLILVAIPRYALDPDPEGARPRGTAVHPDKKNMPVPAGEPAKKPAPPPDPDPAPAAGSN
jgi:hypothetical protein